jgi:acetaldehyde dehydrogenase (acetylating)
MLSDSDLVSIQEVRSKVERAYIASQKLRSFTQEQLDAIVEAMGEAGRSHAKRLAELAVQETGYGNVKDKIAKNLLNADLLVRRIRGMKTIGVLREVPENKIVEIGVPVGVIAAILPTTNPTSTAIYKSIISLKAGNSVVISPHPRAKNCTCETANVLYEAARKAGAPEDCILCVNNATMEGTQELMKHRRTSVILATGGHGIVHAAYSSGKPAYGVGPGNVPVLLDRGADMAASIAKVVDGKSFDFGTVCSSEQTLVVLEEQKAAVISELKKNKSYLCNADQTKALAKLLILPGFRINANVVGQSPQKIARMSGFEVPDDVRILVVEIGGVGKEHPLSMEKLSPVLSLLSVKNWDEQIKMCQALLKFGGLGHTCVIHATDDARIREFGMRMPAFRVLVNTPAPPGSTGITTGVFPAMTLGCGAMAGNATSDNVGPQHLMNIKRLAYVVRTLEEAFPNQPASAPAPVVASRPLAASSSTLANGVADAVERYLSQKGFKPSTGAAPAKPVALGNVVGSIVDQFLSGKGASSPASTDSGCGCAVTPVAPAAKKPEPAAQLPISDFVCESDVREAMGQSKKIYIGPKTIVTPSARELAGQHDVLVMAQR